MTLEGKVGVIVGVANGHSIAAGCARAFHAAGAEQVITYFNDKAKPHVAPVAEAVQAAALEPLDVEKDEEIAAVFAGVKQRWGRVDFVLHSVAFCPKEDLHAPVIDASRAGFARAMDVSCHSFIRLAKAAKPLMTEGGCLLTVTYYGAEKVVDNYNIMGPVKAALESTTRYLAANLGPDGIRVNALSPGPMATRAASGIAHFDALMDEATARSPQRTLVSLEDVGALATFLASDAAKHVTGNIAYVDAGYHVMS